MEKNQTEFSVLMFPWLGYSHVYPYFELAKILSQRSYFSIYFCSSAINLDSIKNIIVKEDLSIDLVELHVPSLPNLPPHFHTTKNLPPNLMPILLQAFQESSSNFLKILKTLKPDLLIYDFFQPWAAKQASSQGIPSVYFATSGAAPFSYFYHHYTHGTAFPYEEIYLLDHEKVDLHAPVELKVKDAIDADFGFGVFTLSTDIVLIKSLRGVERKYIDYLSQLCHKKVVPTGPLVHHSVSDHHIDEEKSEILVWLSEQGRFSTVFICFGSESILSMDQIVEVAKGLELCEANFVWSVRFHSEKLHSLENALPEGFLQRVQNRGLVVEGWAPQSKILSHPSIGGFMSHCGWSSILESTYFGVPVIAMPIKFDQPINARLVVDAGVGVEVNKGEDGVFSGEEIGSAINKVIVEKTGEDMRVRAKNLSEKMKKEEAEAVSEAADQLLSLCKKSSK